MFSYYKSVNQYGESCRETRLRKSRRWSLPILDENNNWIPGSWQYNNDLQPQLMVTANPYVWLERNEIVYECEVPDDCQVVSAGRIGAKFTVSKARLMRPFTGCIYDDKHIKEQHYVNGVPHRDDDMPAIIYYNGTKKWYKHGLLHRDHDQPAAIFLDGQTQIWYKNGKLHREGNEPALVHIDGRKEWYVDGEFLCSNTVSKLSL